MRPENKVKSLAKSLRTLTLIGSFGLMMGASLMMGYFLGDYIDRKLGTSPWFMMVFLLLFMVGAFVKLFQEVAALDSSEQPRAENDSKQTGQKH